MVAQQFPDRGWQGSIGNDPHVTLRAVIFSARTWFMRHCWLSTTAPFGLCGHNLSYGVMITILPAPAHGQQLVFGANPALLADRLTGSAIKPLCNIVV